MVRGWNSSYFGAKYRSCTLLARCLGLPVCLDECLVDDYLRGDVRQLTSLPGFHLLAHGLEVPLHAIHAD